MTCPSCALAEADAATGHFHADCQECQTRAIAHGQEFFDWRQIRDELPAYRGVLERQGGTNDPEAVKALHLRVLAWARRIQEARAAA